MTWHSAATAISHSRRTPWWVQWKPSPSRSMRTTVPVSTGAGLERQLHPELALALGLVDDCLQLRDVAEGHDEAEPRQHRGRGAHVRDPRGLLEVHERCEAVVRREVIGHWDSACFSRREKTYGARSSA
jgi:hypothetical protein